MKKELKVADKTTGRDMVTHVVGNFLADILGIEVLRINEGLVVGTDDGDVVVKIIQKTTPIEIYDGEWLEEFASVTGSKAGDHEITLDTIADRYNNLYLPSLDGYVDRREEMKEEKPKAEKPKDK